MVAANKREPDFEGSLRKALRQYMQLRFGSVSKSHEILWEAKHAFVTGVLWLAVSYKASQRLLDAANVLLLELAEDRPDKPTDTP